MKPYVRTYLDFFGFDESDFIPCECCGDRAVDINHIICKGMGGSKTKDYIENLMAVCRQCHEKYGDKKQHFEYLMEIHARRMGRITE